MSKIYRTVQHPIGCVCGRCNNTGCTVLEEYEIPENDRDPALDCVHDDEIAMLRGEIAALSAERDLYKELMGHLEVIRETMMDGSVSDILVVRIAHGKEGAKAFRKALEAGK